MDPTYPPEGDAYREKVQAFLAEHLPADWHGIGALDPAEAEAFAKQWRTTLHEHGYLAAAWPKDLGGPGLTPLEQVVLAEELERAGVPAGAPNDTFSIQMVGNTIVQVEVRNVSEGVGSGASCRRRRQDLCAANPSQRRAHGASDPARLVRRRGLPRKLTWWLRRPASP